MNFVLLPKIAAEGYCCIHGYLRLCKARGESRKNMVKWIKISPWTLAHNYRMLAQGKRPCANYSDCMIPIIQELEASQPTAPAQE